MSILGDRLKLLTAENISLVVSGMFPVALKEISIEEAALCKERVKIICLERVVQEKMHRAIREFGLDHDVTIFREEAEELAGKSVDISRRIADLSVLEAIVRELSGLEGDASSYSGYSLGELQSILEEVTAAASNVQIDWCGTMTL